MRSEIEQVLTSLRERPSDAQALAQLDTLLNGDEAPPTDLSDLFARHRDYHERVGEWSTVVRLLDAELGVASGDRKAELLALKGQVLEEELLDEEGALEALRAALALRPEDSRTRETLEQIELVRENWRAVSDKYVKEAESATDRDLSANLYRSAAEVIWRNEPDAPEVEEYLKRSLDVDPHDRKSSSHLERLLRRKERYAEVAELLERRAAIATSREDRVQAFLSAGELWALHLASADKAADYFKRALALAPTSPRALRYLVDHYTQAEDYAALARVYEDALRAHPRGEVDTGTLLQIGLLYARKLDQPERAEEYFRRVRKADATQPLMLNFYREHYRQRGEPGKILALLDAAQRATHEEAARLSLSREMAEVAEQEVKNLDKAIDLWKHLGRSGDAELERAATVALKRLYRGTNPPKWNALRELLKEEIDALPDEQVDEKIALLLEVVEIYRDHLRLDVMVVNTYNAILALKPDHVGAIDALVDKYESIGRWNDLIGVLVRKKELAEGEQERVTTLHRIADLWAERLGNQGQAVEPLEEILELRPNEERATERLRSIYTRRRNWRALISLCARQAENAEGEARRELTREMARLASERLADAAIAIEVWNGVLARDAEDAEALEELSQLYRREGRWPALAEILHRQRDAADAAGEGERVVTLYGELGAIYRDRLGAPTQAAEMYKALLERAPDDEAALEVLCDLYVEVARWDDLEQLLTARERHAELADTLTAAADRTADHALKLRLYSRVGEIHHRRLDAPDRAIKAYERALAAAPDNVEMLETLAPLYLAGEKWGRLLATYESLLEHREAKASKLELLAEIRRLYEDQLGAKQLAFEWCARAYRLDPRDDKLDAELERLAGEADAYEELVEILREQCDKLEDDEAKVAMLRRLALLSSEKLHHTESAEQFYSQLLALSPEDRPALDALEQIYSSTQQWPRLISVLHRQAALVEGQERVDVLFKIAFLQEDRLGDPVSAIDSYNAIVEIDEHNARALKALERLHEARGEWSALAAVLRRQLTQAEDSNERASVLYRIGEIQDVHLEMQAPAIATYAEVLEHDPVHRQTVLALERHLDAPVDDGAGHRDQDAVARRARVAALLRPFYERNEDFPRLRQTIEVLIERAETAGDRDELVELLERLKTICERRLDDYAAAFIASHALFEINARDADNRRQLLALAERVDQLPFYAQALEEALVAARGGDGDGEEREPQDIAHEQALLGELSDIWEQRLGQPERAEPHLRRLIELDANNRGARESLERVLQGGGKWQELRAHLAQWLEHSLDAVERKRLLLAICALDEDVLADVEAAITSYEAVLEVEPEHPEALAALERHYRATERWEKLSQLYAKRIDIAETGDERRRYKLLLAELRVAHIDDAQGAVDLLEEIVSEQPDAEAVLLLERLLGEEELAARVAEILERVYDATGAHAQLVEILLLRRLLSDNPDYALELLIRAAELQEQALGDRDRALASYLEAMGAAPRREALWEEVARLAEELGRWEDLANGYRAAAEAAGDGDIAVRADLYRRLAMVELQRLGDADLARGTYEKLLALDEDNPDIAGKACEALAVLHEDAGRHEELARVLSRTVAWAPDSGAREEILARIARLREIELSQPDEAIEAWRAVLEENPRSLDALDALERLYLHASRWRDLIGIFRRRIEHSDNVRERALLHQRIAEIYELELDDREESIISLLAILDELPEDVATLVALARHYREAERWPDLLEMLERQAALSPDGPGHVDLVFQIATLLRERLYDTGLAIERYRQVLELEPGHGPARTALVELLDDEQHGTTVAQLLAELYERGQEWRELVVVLEWQARRAGGPRRVELLRRIAALSEAQLGDNERAFAALCEALGPAAAEPELQQITDDLVRLAAQKAGGGPAVWARAKRQAAGVGAGEPQGDDADDVHVEVEGVPQDAAPEGEGEGRAEEREPSETWRTVVDGISGIIADVLDGELSLRLHLLVAEASDRELHDAERARDHYLRVLDVDPTHREALEAVETLYRDGGEWELLREILLRRVELAEGVDERAYRLAESGRIARDKLERIDDAIADFERVLEMVPDHPEADAALDDLYQQARRLIDLDQLLERRLDRTSGAAQRVEILARLGVMRAGDLADPMRALDAWRELLRIEHENPQAIAAVEGMLDDLELQADAALVLEPLYAQRQDWPALIRIYEIRLATADDPQQRLSLVERIAQLYEEQLEDLEQAFVWYGKVFVEKPEDGKTRDQLRRLAGILDRWEELAELLSRSLDSMSDDDPLMRDLSLLAANIFDDRLHRWEPAKSLLERVLTVDRGDRQVFGLLERMLMRYDRWQELLGLYRDAADATMDPSEQRDLMLKICRVWEEALDDIDEAISAYRAVLDLDESDSEAVSALDRLLWQTERWDDLIALLERQVEFMADESAIVAQKLRLGGIAEVQLEDLTRAIDYYEEALTRDPQSEDALAALERLVLERDHRFRISKILEPIYEAQDEWAKLVVIYDAQLEFIEEKGRRIELLREIARLHEERGGSMQLALRALESAYELEPSDEELWNWAARVADRIASHESLAALCERVVAEAYDYDLQAELYGRLARIREHNLGDPSSAAEAWAKVLTVREDDSSAIGNLIRLYTDLERWEDLAAVLRRKADYSSDPQQQKVIYQQIAEVQEEKLGEVSKAIEAWRTSLGFDERDRRALDALQRLYEAVGEWVELIWVLGQKVENVDDPVERRELGLKRAQVYDSKIQDAYEAIAAYKTLVDWDPLDLEALEALDRLYARESLWTDLLEVVDLKAAASEDPDGVLALRFRGGMILAEQIGDIDAALGRFELVLSERPSHPQAREQLTRLLGDENYRERSADVLERVYEESGEVEPLIGVLEARVGATADPLRAHELWVRIATLCEQKGETRRAFDAYAKAFSQDPSEGAQRELERLAGALSAEAELADLYEQRLDAIYDNVVQRRLHLEVARIAEQHLGDDERAQRHFRLALDTGAGDEQEPLAALDRVLSRRLAAASEDQEQTIGERLLEVLERRADGERDTSAQAELLYRVGELRVQLSGDLDGAFIAYRDALDREPTHAGARQSMDRLLLSDVHRVQVLDVLEPLYEQAGDHQKLVELYETRLGTVDDKPGRAELLERLAGLYEHQLGQASEALGAFGRALAEDPSNSGALDQAERLASQLGRFAELAALLEEITGIHGELSTEIEPDTARDLALRVGRWYVEQLSDIDRAERVYQRVLQAHPEARAALDALERIYRASARDAELADVLGRSAELEYDIDKKRALLAEAARLWQQVDNSERAIACWRAVIDVDEGDRQALESLALLFERTGAVEDLLDNLEQQVLFAETGEAQIALKRRAAELYRHQLEDLDRAAQCYRDILDIEPDDASALSALEALYSEREDWASVHEILVRQLDRARGRGPGAAVPVLFRLADLAERNLESIDDAASYLNEVLELAPENGEAQGKLESLLERGEKWYDLIDLRRRTAERLLDAGDGAAATAQRLRIARIWTEKLENPDAAAEVLESVLEREPQHVGALAELARIYEATEQWERCGEVLRQAAALDPSAQEGAEIAFRLGRIAARTGEERDVVVAHYGRALALDENHDEAAAALEQIAREDDDVERLVALLERRVHRIPEDQLAVVLEVLGELGALYRDRLGRAADSVAAFEMARQIAPEDKDVLSALAEAYYSAERYDDVEPILESLIAQAGARRTKALAGYHYRLGTIAKLRGDVAKARERFDAAYRTDSTHLPTLVELGALYFAAEDWQNARRIYRSMLLQNVDDKAGITRADLFYHLGRVHEGLGETSKALSMYERGLESDADHPALAAALAALKG
ncbi:MAG: tetratricopeptide repeat protein [Myxococcales bacterium]|nr:tetratricopeptide repeat protein [Myxococcales bacterium]